MSELEQFSAKRLRTVAKLEEALAYLHATGRIPWKTCHRTIKYIAYRDGFDDERINAIDYFRCILRNQNKEMSRLQCEKQALAESGGTFRNARSWMERSASCYGSINQHILNAQLVRASAPQPTIDVCCNESITRDEETNRKRIESNEHLVVFTNKDNNTVGEPCIFDEEASHIALNEESGTTEVSNVYHDTYILIYFTISWLKMINAIRSVVFEAN